jgi:hypothetical protein
MVSQKLTAHQTAKPQEEFPLLIGKVILFPFLNFVSSHPLDSPLAFSYIESYLESDFNEWSFCEK